MWWHVPETRQSRKKIPSDIPSNFFAAPVLDMPFLPWPLVSVRHVGAPDDPIRQSRKLTFSLVTDAQFI